MSADARGETSDRAGTNRVQELSRQFRPALVESTAAHPSPPRTPKLPKVVHQFVKAASPAGSKRNCLNLPSATDDRGSSSTSRPNSTASSIGGSPIGQRREVGVHNNSTISEDDRVGRDGDCACSTISSASSMSAVPPDPSVSDSNDDQVSRRSLSFNAPNEPPDPVKRPECDQPAIVRLQNQCQPAFPSRPDTDTIIGLEHLQDQVRKLAIRKGFTLNLMVIGRSGLGKSTLINTLFQSAVLVHRDKNEDRNKNATVSKTTEIRTTQTVILENGIKLLLSVTDTPGFGDLIDNSDCWELPLKYINDQYEKYLKEEQSTHRARHSHDTRIHCCLYFIPPTGHGLRPLDIEVLTRLHKVVNVIPVVAKSDTMTIEERQEFKKIIQNDLKQNQIEIYPMSQYEHEEDFAVNESYRTLSPFCVVGSQKIYEVNGQKVLGRHNRWGLVEVENPHHCEFHYLRDLLIRNRMQDLIELTSDIFYESFRRRRLMELNNLMANAIDISSLNESHI